jgi:hypothetical protein
MRANQKNLCGTRRRMHRASLRALRQGLLRLLPWLYLVGFLDEAVTSESIQSHLESHSESYLFPGHKVVDFSAVRRDLLRPGWMI